MRERAEKIQAGKEIQGRPREARIRSREGEEKIYGRRGEDLGKVRIRSREGERMI